MNEIRDQPISVDQLIGMIDSAIANQQGDNRIAVVRRFTLEKLKKLVADEGLPLNEKEARDCCMLPLIFQELLYDGYGWQSRTASLGHLEEIVEIDVVVWSVGYRRAQLSDSEYRQCCRFWNDVIERRKVNAGNPKTHKVTDSAPVLDYPRDLHVCSFSYRTARGYFTLAAGVLMIIPFVWIGIWGPGSAMFRLAFLVCAAFGAVCNVVFAFLILTDAHHVVRLTTAGVESRRKLVPWSKITRVAANGKSSSHAVQLFYTVQMATGITTNRLISVGKGMSVAQYQQLIEVLKPELSAAHPTLEIGGYFQVET